MYSFPRCAVLASMVLCTLAAVNPENVSTPTFTRVMPEEVKERLRTLRSQYTNATARSHIRLVPPYSSVQDSTRASVGRNKAHARRWLHLFRLFLCVPLPRPHPPIPPIPTFFSHPSISRMTNHLLRTTPVHCLPPTDSPAPLCSVFTFVTLPFSLRSFYAVI